jgi:hypothetical protein
MKSTSIFQLFMTPKSLCDTAYTQTRDTTVRLEVTKFKIQSLLFLNPRLTVLPLYYSQSSTSCIMCVALMHATNNLSYELLRLVICYYMYYVLCLYKMVSRRAGGSINNVIIIIITWSLAKVIAFGDADTRTHQRRCNNIILWDNSTNGWRRRADGQLRRRDSWWSRRHAQNRDDWREQLQLVGPSLSKPNFTKFH